MREPGALNIRCAGLISRRFREAGVYRVVSWCNLCIRRRFEEYEKSNSAKARRSMVFRSTLPEMQRPHLIRSLSTWNGPFPQANYQTPAYLLTKLVPPPSELHWQTGIAFQKVNTRTAYIVFLIVAFEI